MDTASPRLRRTKPTNDTGSVVRWSRVFCGWRRLATAEVTARLRAWLAHAAHGHTRAFVEQERWVFHAQGQGGGLSGSTGILFVTLASLAWFCGRFAPVRFALWRLPTLRQRGVVKGLRAKN